MRNNSLQPRRSGTLTAALLDRNGALLETRTLDGLTLAAEQSGAGVRLLPFQTPQDCFAYLRESGYAREALQPSTRQADGSIQNETEKTLWTQWEEGT